MWRKYEEELLTIAILFVLFLAVFSVFLGWGLSLDGPQQNNTVAALEQGHGHDQKQERKDPGMDWFVDVYASSLECFSSDDFILPCGKDGCLRLREDAPACAIELWNRIDGRLDYGSQQSVKGSIVQKLRKRERL